MGRWEFLRSFGLPPFYMEVVTRTIAYHEEKLTQAMAVLRASMYYAHTARYYIAQ